MKEHRITLRADEVSAMLDNAVSQIATLAATRRDRDDAGNVLTIFRPTHAPGDLVWAGEDWFTGVALDEMTAQQIAEACREAGYDEPWCPLRYAADGLDGSLCELADFGGEYGRRRLAHHLPRWLARFVLRVVRVRACKLDELGDADAIALGYPAREYGGRLVSPLQRFRAVWFERHPPSRYGGRANPLVQLSEVEVLSWTLDGARELARKKGRAA